MEKTNSAPTTGVVGTILGSVGTAGVLAAGGLNLLNGGMNGKPNHLMEEMDKLRAENVSLKMGRETDDKIVEAYNSLVNKIELNKDVQAGTNKELYQELVRSREAEIRTEEKLSAADKIRELENLSIRQDFKCQLNALEAQTKLGFQQLSGEIAVEAERRAAADCNIREWATCTFVPYIKKIDSTQLCPPVTSTTTTTTTTP